jgi:hypothetical protein
LKILLLKNAIKTIMRGVWAGFCMKKLEKKNIPPLRQEASVIQNKY